MNIENNVKELILEKYGTLKDFSKEIDLPYSTVYGMFNRGFLNSTVDNMLALCTALNISADQLANGHIEFKETEYKAPTNIEELETAVKSIYDSANIDRIINGSEASLLKNNLEAVMLLIKHERDLKA